MRATNNGKEWCFTPTGSSGYTHPLFTDIKYIYPNLNMELIAGTKLGEKGYSGSFKIRRTVNIEHEVDSQFLHE